MQYSHCGSAPAPPPLAPLVPGYGPDAGPWMSQGLPGMMTAPMDHHHAWARQALLSNEQPGSVFLVQPTKMNPGTLKCFKLYTLISGLVFVFKCRFKHSDLGFFEKRYLSTFIANHAVSIELPSSAFIQYRWPPNVGSSVFRPSQTQRRRPVAMDGKNELVIRKVLDEQETNQI